MQFKRFAKPLSQIFGGAARDTPVPADAGAAADPAVPNPASALDSASPEQLMATALGDGHYLELPGDHFTALTTPEFETAMAGFLAGSSPASGPGQQHRADDPA